MTKASSDSEKGDSSMGYYLLSALVIGAFTANGLVQERVTGKKAVFGEGDHAEKFTNGKDFMILGQSVTACLGAAAVLLATFGSGKGIAYKLTADVPMTEWLVIAVAFFGSHQFGYGSLSYIPYSLYTVTKCCKPIATMLGTVVINQESYPPSKYISIGLLVAGVIIFQFFKPSKKPAAGGAADGGFKLDADTMIGIGMVAAGLVCSAFYGPRQKTVQKEAAQNGHKLSPFHNMFAMNLFQGLIQLGTMAWAGSLAPSVAFIGKHPELGQLLVLQFATYFVGAAAIFGLINRFGPLSVTKVTTYRKLVSVMMSVAIFGHPFSPLQGIGVLVVVFSKILGKEAANALGLEKKGKDKKTE